MKVDLLKYGCEAFLKDLGSAIETGELDTEFIQNHISNCEECRKRIPNLFSDFNVLLPSMLFKFGKKKIGK